MKNLLCLLLLFPSLAWGDYQFYFNGNLGPSWLEGKDGEADKSGTSSELKMINSWYLGNWNLDLGAGYFLNNQKGKRLDGTEVEVITKGFLVDLDFKHKIINNFYLGPAVKGIFGDGVSFSETLKDGTKENILAGIRGSYNLEPLMNFPFRLEFGFFSTLKERQNTMALFGVSFGFPGEKSKNSIPIEPDTLVKHEKYLKEKILTIRYRFDSHKLSDEAEQQLVRLAGGLFQNPDKWDKIVITGHTDNFGPEKYNLTLSLKRAKQIKSLLTAQGIDPEKIETIGAGEEHPLNGNKDKVERWINRRADIEIIYSNIFEGFKNSLIQMLKEETKYERK